MIRRKTGAFQMLSTDPRSDLLNTWVSKKYGQAQWHSGAFLLAGRWQMFPSGKKLCDYTPTQSLSG